jgi:hypothetical protein
MLKARRPIHKSEDWAFPEEFTSAVPAASVRAVYLSKNVARAEAMNSAENEWLTPDEDPIWNRNAEGSIRAVE